MRITGISTTTNTLSSGSYYFKIAENGIITKNSLWDASTTPLNSFDMTSLFSGNYDDQSYQLDPVSEGGFAPTFLGTSYTDLFVSGNGGFSFGASNDLRNNDPTSASTDANVPCLYMNNNDAALYQIFYTVSGTSPNRILAYKISGNTNYDVGGTNYSYDIYFYENLPGKVDVVVAYEPASWGYYADGIGQVKWGVTNGTTWVDGLADHSSSLGASAKGLRITGQTGLRITSGSAPAPSGATITIPDLYYVVSGPVSGSTYINGGGYDYVVFAATPALTGAIITQYGITPNNPGFFGPHPVTWSSGSDSTNGYVYLQVTSTSDFQFYSSDVDGNPLAGTWVFPMTFV